MSRFVSLLLLTAACGTSPGVPARGIGVISIERYASSSTPQQGEIASAYFVEGGPPCERDEVVGPCEVRVGCTKPADPPYVSAGPIELGNAHEAVTLVPRADGSYPSHDAPQPLFAPGAQLAIEAFGGEVPAFETTLVVPAQTQISWPYPGPISSADHTAGLDLVWSSVIADSVQVGLEQGDTYTVTSLSCRFPAASGQGTVPPAALSVFRAGEAQLVVDSVTSVTRDVDGWSVDISAGYEALMVDGASANLRIMLR